MRRGGIAGAGAAALLAMAGCDGGLVSIGGGDGAPVDVQIAHPAGVVLQVLSVKTSGERAAVTVRVMNAREREIDLAWGKDHNYLLTDAGEKLMLVPSPTNEDLEVPAGRMADAVLVFTGALPSSGQATMILNAHDSGSNQYSTQPKLEAVLPLDGARGGGIPEASGLSNLRPLPASRFGPAAAGGSTFGAAGNAASSLQAVEKLKSELGAVETERGTMVSLPGDVTFDFDKATIQPGARATLDQLAALIAAGGPGEIMIEGHTDAKGDDAYNKKLSEERAAAVKAYLVEKGAEPARLKTIGLGELRPVAPNAAADGSDDEEGRQRNRRVEVILPKAAGASSAPGATTAPSAPPAPR